MNVPIVDDTDTAKHLLSMAEIVSSSSRDKAGVAENFENEANFVTSGLSVHDSKMIGTTRADASGIWSHPLMTDLSDSLHHLKASTHDDSFDAGKQVELESIVATSSIETPAYVPITDVINLSNEAAHNARVIDTPSSGTVKIQSANLLIALDDSVTLVEAQVTPVEAADFVSPVQESLLNDFSANTLVDEINNKDKSDLDNVKVYPSIGESNDEDFDSEEDRVLEQGQHHLKSGLEIEILNIGDGVIPQYANAISSNGHEASANKQLILSTNSIAKLVFENTKSISFDYNSVQTENGGSVSFYNSDGNLLGSVTLSKTIETSSEGNIISDDPLNISFTAPDGQAIAYAMITINPVSSNEPSVIGFDNIHWGPKVEIIPDQEDERYSDVNIGMDANPFYISPDLLDLNTSTFVDPIKIGSTLASEQHDVSILPLTDILSDGQNSLFLDFQQPLLNENLSKDSVELSDLLNDGTHLEQWRQIADTVSATGEQYESHQQLGTDIELLVQQGEMLNLLTQ